MTEDLESSTAAAWVEFERRLGRRLEAMEEDDLLLLEVPGAEEGAGAAPYVQFCAWGDDVLRCEAVSNHYLIDSWRLDDAAVVELVEMGFSAPTYSPGDAEDEGSANFYLDGDRDDSKVLAMIAVQALRDVYGVPHPSLLDADGLVEPAPEEPHASPAPMVSDDDGVTWQMPESPHQLQEMVDNALEPLLGQVPVKDEDGDIPIITSTGVVYVRVLAESPEVELFTTVLAGVTDRELALHEVNVLNRDEAAVKFVLRQDRVTAARRVNGLPFAGEHFRRAVTDMCVLVDRAHEDLAPRLPVASDDGFENPFALPDGDE